VADCGADDGDHGVDGCHVPYVWFVMGDYAYGHNYRKLRAAMLGLPCELQLVCSGAPADSADHTPPLSRHQHFENSGCCFLRPACMECQGEQAKALSMETKRLNRLVGQNVVEVEGTSGLVQSVEWL